MAPDRDRSILETVFAALRGAGWVGDVPVLAGDSLKDLGLSRLRLLAALIELEDSYDIEFPADSVDRFRIVRDIAAYIQAHALTVHDEPIKRPVAANTAPNARVTSVGDRLRQFCARAFRRNVAVPAG
jgi:acyl carrier protein